MIPVLSRAEMRAFDAQASAACQVPSLLLMENAGRGAAELIAAELGAAQIEFHTGEYCHKQGTERAAELERLKRAATLAHGLGLEVAAGHGLTRFNVLDIAAIPELVELNIGHSVIGDAVLVGLDRAVRDLRTAIERGMAQRPSA